MATQITIQITNNDPYLFNLVPFLVLAIVDGNVTQGTAIPTDATNANAFFNVVLSPGPHTIQFAYSATATSNAPVVDTQNVATIAYSFNDIPSTANSVNVNYVASGASYNSVTTNVTLACLHGNSVITTINGPKFIKDAKEGEKVLTANGEYAEIKIVAHCWLRYNDTEHDAIIMEPNSLAPELPNERLIIDPGHPIKINIEDEFKPAGDFVNDNNIYVRKWTDEIIQNPTPSRRWDLVLEEGFDNYIANGVIVKSRKNVLMAGYDIVYKQWN